MTDEENKLIKQMIKRNKEHCVDDVDYSVPFLINLIEKQSKEIEELKKPKYIIDCKTNEIKTLTNDFISKDKIKPIQIIDLDGKIHNVYKIEEV